MKRFVLIVVLAGLVVFGLMAQERMPDLKQYFMQTMELQSADWDFWKNPLRGDDPADNVRFSNLTGNLQVIDSYLEFALLTYYSVAERPWAELGNSILPLNNPRLVDRQLGAYVYKDLVVSRFLNDTAVTGRHETMLQFIIGRGNVTRAEVEAYYRQGIRGLIAEIVDEEFNKTIAFLMSSPAGGHNAVLMRNPQNGQYVLNYGGVNTNNETRTVTGNSLDNLLHEMRYGDNKSDFLQSSIDQVNIQAARIPAVAHTSELERTKTTITNFFLTSNDNTYRVLTGLYNSYMFNAYLRDPFLDTLSNLNSDLAMRIKRR